MLRRENTGGVRAVTQFDKKAKLTLYAFHCHIHLPTAPELVLGSYSKNTEP